MIPNEKLRAIADVARLLLPPTAADSNSSVVVFDIDDTLITPYGTPMQPIIDLYRECCQQRFKIAVITARPHIPGALEYTRHQFAIAGIPEPDYFYFRPFDDQSVDAFKENSRKDLWLKGHRVIMTVGDMPWDHGRFGGVPILVN